MKRYFALLAILLVVLLISPVSSSAQPTDKVRFLQTVEVGKHVTHHLPRPTDLGDFASLEEWIKANYTIYLLADTLKHSTRGGQDAISFFTMSEDGRADHNVLVDTGDEFTLQTTSTIKPPQESVATADAGDMPENETSIKASLMATAAVSSSCATGSTWNSSLTPPGYQRNACNCVLYVRCLVPSFPSPATYLTEKLQHNNVSYPSMGWVAIMNYDYPYGHVGVIDGMWWAWQGYISNLNLSLNEANYYPCQVMTNRTGTPGTLHIVGYFRP
jgi:hypothetical protein